MSSVIERLRREGLIRPPTWLTGNVRYESMMGSHCYGVATQDSDYDMVGWCVPPKDMIFPHLGGHIQGFGRQVQKFTCYEQHRVYDKVNQRTYDLTCYNIVHYFRLCMDNNPNMLDSLFVPRDCITHSSQIAEMVRVKRHLFLHKGAWHKFKGYAYSQLHKMDNKEPVGKRKATVEKYGYDCYVEDETEFLTERGWLRFDEVDDKTRLATVEKHTGELQWELPKGRVDKIHSGAIYEIHPSMSRCMVTPGHQILCSPTRRSEANNFSCQYDVDSANWRLTPLEDVAGNGRSWFHVRRAVKPRTDEYPIEDAYLKLAGLYVSEGTTNFLDGKVKAARFTQSKENPAFYQAADSLGLTRYDYPKETVWTIKRRDAERLYSDFGHGSLKLRLPDWCLQLSHRQVGLFFHHLWLGDGTPTSNGDVYYTSNECLAGNIQAMLTSAGYLCSVRGPFTSDTTFKKDSISYQVYRSNESSFACMDFNRVGKIPRDGSQGNPIKKIDVYNRRVVCFTVVNGTLVTRCQGNTAIQGNCKFAYHLVRLLGEVEQILDEHDIDLRRNREHLKAIRRGEVSEDDIRKWAADKEHALEALYVSSSLRHTPDQDAIKQLLIDCLEEHFGNLDGCIVTDNQPIIALRNIADIIDKNRSLFS